MDVPADAIRTIYAVATLTSIALFVWIWQYRDQTGAKPLLVTFAGAIVWCGAPLFGTLVTSEQLSIFAYRVLFVGVGVGVFGLFVFSLEYTGHERWIRPWTLGALAVEPILAATFAFTNPGNLFFAAVSTDGSAWGVLIDWGVAFWMHAAYSYLLMLAASILILDFLLRSQAVYRGQAVALLFGTLLPWILSLAHIIGPVEFNSTPLGIAGGGAFFAIAITRYRLIDIVPIARDRVVDTIQDAVLVIDRDERVIDANHTAKALVGRPDVSILGEPLSTFFAESPQLVEHYREIVDDTDSSVTAERTFDVSVGERAFESRLSRIDDGRGRHVGWLLVARDVTAQKRREAALEQRNKQLDQFASIVSHDLRNPLNVATARLNLAREECDSSHLDHVVDAHDRIETIVDETLTLARLGHTVDNIEDVDLGAHARQCWNVVETGDGSLEITFEKVVIRADSGRLRHVFENLFRNAIEHSDEPVTVTVGVLSDGFSIADDGSGLPDGIDIFEPGSTTGEEGTGLGLSIVEEVVSAHGWEIRATESDTGGAQFEITGVEIVDENSSAS